MTEFDPLPKMPMNRVAKPMPTDAPDQISVAAIAHAMSRNRVLIIGSALACGLLAGVHAVRRPTTYSAIAWFKPQEQQTQSQTIAGLASPFGLSLSASSAMTPQAYADLAISREILRPVAESRFSYHVGSMVRSGTLTNLYSPGNAPVAQRREGTIVMIGKQVTTSVSKTGAVALTVTTPHAELSQQLATSIMDQLDSLSLRTQMGRATPEREFVEQQMVVAQQALNRAENRLAGFLESNRQITTPQLQLERDRITREVSMRQQLYTSLVEAFQSARIDEVRNMPVVTVLERPDVPYMPDSHRTASTIALGLTFGLVLGLFSAFLRDTWKHLRRVVRDEEAGTAVPQNVESKQATPKAGGAYSAGA